MLAAQHEGRRPYQKQGSGGPRKGGAFSVQRRKGNVIDLQVMAVYSLDSRAGPERIVLIAQGTSLVSRCSQ